MREVMTAKRITSSPIMLVFHSCTPSLVRSAQSCVRLTPQAASSFAPKLSSACAVVLAPEEPATMAVQRTVGARVVALKSMAVIVP